MKSHQQEYDGRWIWIVLLAVAISFVGMLTRLARGDEPIVEALTAPVRITQANDATGYTFADKEGNPWGQFHQSATTGVVRTLTAADVTFNVNTLAVATRNSQRMQRILDEAPDSGITFIVPADLCFIGLKFPTRTIGGLPDQPIPCSIRGARPNVQMVNISTGPAFLATNGPNGVVFPGMKTVRQRLDDLSIVSRGPGVVVNGCGLYFDANDVEVRSEAENGWEFSECYGLHLGRVGALTCKGNGFLFRDCIMVTCDNLWSRGNAGAGLVLRGKAHDCAAFFGSYDVEGNTGWQADFENAKNCRMNGYQEYPLRIRMMNCQNIDWAGEGIRVDESDKVSRLFNPVFFTTKTTPLDLQAIPYSIYTGSQFKALTNKIWTLEHTGGADGWVSVTPDMLPMDLHEQGFNVRFRITESKVGQGGYVGVAKWSANGNVPVMQQVDRDGVYKMPVFTKEKSNRIFWFAAPDSKVKFELLGVDRIEEAP